MKKKNTYAGYSDNGGVKASDGYPFPVKLSIRCIRCTHENLENDYKTIKELISHFDQCWCKSGRAGGKIGGKMK